MNRVLTASSLLAASLAFIPTASQAQSQVKFMNVMDASAVDESVADLFRLPGYEGPVVIVQTERHEELPNGYAVMMTFSESRLGPIEGHPLLELVDGEALEGAPMFLTDRVDTRKLREAADLPIEPRNIAGVVDLQWAADDIFDELNEGVGEGDFLVVTHKPVADSDSDGGSAQEVYAANVFDPQSSSSYAIEDQAGLSFFDRAAHAVLMDAQGERIAHGFRLEVKPVWVHNGPVETEASSDDSGTNGGTDGDEKQEDSQREDVIDGRSIDMPEDLGGSVDLPEFTPSPRSPVREGGRFAPAMHRAAYRG